MTCCDLSSLGALEKGPSGGVHGFFRLVTALAQSAKPSL